MATDLELLALSQLAPLGLPVTVTPATASASGTPTSGTAEVFDAVLGYYQVSLTAGRRYAVVVNGLLLGATAANDTYALRIRNSGTSSNPTTSSTVVAASQWVCPIAGGSGEESVYVAGSFLAPATGINTFGLSAARLAGTGVLTPLSGNGSNRELYVMYLGIA